MEPTIIGSWSKRSSRAIATSSGDEAPPGGSRPQKKMKHHASVSEQDSSVEEDDEHDRKYTSDLLLIRDVVEELQSNERDFHRSQQARYECLKRTIIDMESRWTREKYKRSMAKAKRETRELVQLLSKQAGLQRDVSSKLQDHDMMKKETMTPVAAREVVSSLPTPSETAIRLAFQSTSNTQVEESEQGPGKYHIQRGGDEPPRFSAEQKGKQPIRLSSPTPKPRKKNPGIGLRSPFEPTYREPSVKRSRKSKTPVPAVINSSDGDDEDENAEDASSLENEFAQCAGISNEDVALAWPIGVGIGSESIEVEMPDHMSASDAHFSSPNQTLSPLTVCAVDSIAPVATVGPRPFKMTPQLATHTSPHTRSLRKRTDRNYRERLSLGLSDDDTYLLTPPVKQNPKSDLQRSDDDESYRPEPIPENNTMAVGTSKPKSSGEVRNVIHVKKDVVFGQKAPGATTPGAKRVQQKSEERNNQWPIFRRMLLSPSDDDNDEPDERMDVDRIPPPTRAPPQPPVTLCTTASTRELIQALGVPTSVLNFPNPMTRFTRAQIQKALGGKSRGTITVVKQNSDKVSPVDQFLCINEKLNPHYPSQPGMHGAMFIFRTGTVLVNTEWAVFCSRTRAGAKPQETFEYVGHYVIKDDSDLSYDEWMASDSKFREGWVNHISREAKAPNGGARINLANMGLIKATDQVLPEQVRGWLNTTTETHARLGRRILGFQEYKRGLYDSLVKAKKLMDD